MKIEEINYLMAEKLGYLKAISFVIGNSNIPSPELDVLIDKMNDDMDIKYGFINALISTPRESLCVLK